MVVVVMATMVRALIDGHLAPRFPSTPSLWMLPISPLLLLLRLLRLPGCCSIQFLHSIRKLPDVDFGESACACVSVCLYVCVTVYVVVCACVYACACACICRTYTRDRHRNSRWANERGGGLTGGWVGGESGQAVRLATVVRVACGKPCCSCRGTSFRRGATGPRTSYVLRYREL